MIDLHIHTIHSDGAFTPCEVVRYANEKRLTAIAITDHDCVSGVKEAQEIGDRLGIEVLSGIEFSTSYETHNINIMRGIHIIGLMIDIENAILCNRIEMHNTVTEKSIKRLFECLINNGFKQISYEDFRTQGNTSSKNHLKQYMASVQMPDINELMKCIANEGIAHVLDPLRKERLTVEGAIDTIHKSGGIAIWAHPLIYKLNSIEFEQTIKTFKTMGLDGVEAYCRGSTQDDFRYIVDLADKNQLLISGGSDFHGYIHQSDLGVSLLSKERIPYSILRSLKAFYK